MSGAFDAETLAAARARHARAAAASAVEAEGFAARLAARPPAPPPLADGAVLAREAVPADGAWHGRLAPGEGLRLVNGGSDGIALCLWNADDPAERLDPADTVKVQWTAAISTGRVLMSAEGRVLASVSFDGFGRNDCLAAGLAAPRPGRPTARERLLEAAAALGLDRRDLGPAVFLFAPVEAGPDGAFAWDGAADPAGTVLDLRAETALLVALANVPHPLGPGRSGPLTLVRHAAPPPGRDDLARTASSAVARAFARTERRDP